MATESQQLKRGKASVEEVKFVRDNVDNLSVEEIAKHLNRSDSFVRKRIAQIPVIKEVYERDDTIAQLHKSHFWLEIQRTLLSSEERFFEQQWAKLVDQFSTNEILATDEMMIKDLIMLEIGTQRARGQKVSAMRAMKELDAKITREYSKPEDQRNAADLANWNQQLNGFRAALPMLSREELDFQAKKDAKLRDLKATRDLRFKNIEESKKNIWEVIKDLDTHVRRKKEGRWAELMRVSADKVKHDWNQFTKFDDAMYNKPFLSPEGQIADRESEKENDR